MLFKNLYMLRFLQPHSYSPERLQKELSEKAFSPAGATQRTSTGWVSPFGGGRDLLVHTVEGASRLTMLTQEKILPASVVANALKEKVAVLERERGSRVPNQEKKALREEIEFDLLPRAFSKYTPLDGYFTADGRYLVLDTSSAAKAEECTNLLRKTLGSLPVTLLETQDAPASVLTNMLRECSAPHEFEIGRECTLKEQGEGAGTTSLRKQHLTGSDVVDAVLNAGEYVSELALVLPGSMSFVITDELVIKKVKFADDFEEQIADRDPQDHAEMVDMQFALMSLTFKTLIPNILDLFGGETAESN